MAKISKNRKAVLAKYNPEKEYSLEDAAKVLKDISFTKFDASVDLDIRLGLQDGGNQVASGRLVVDNQGLDGGGMHGQQLAVAGRNGIVMLAVRPPSVLWDNTSCWRLP